MSIISHLDVNSIHGPLPLLWNKTAVREKLINCVILLSVICSLFVSADVEAQSTVNITWDATFNKPTRIVESGLTTDIAYDTMGRTTQVKQTDTSSQTTPFSTNGRTRVWAYTYTTGSLLASVDGPLAGTSDTTAYSYNAQGYRKTITNELGQITTVTAWNALGQPTSVTDPNGIVATYGYDGMGRLTSLTVNPGSYQAAWSMTYTAVGDLATLTEPMGAVYTLTWDDARRLTRIQNNLGEAVSYTRDAMGNETGRVITAADGSTQTFSQTNTFDELGRRIKQLGGAGPTWAFAYDKTSNLTSVTDPRSKAMGFGFDAVNRLISETERDGGVVQHAYNGKDEETTYTDPRNLATTYVRNGFGEVIQETSPDRGTTVYDYDARGLMISKKDARNVTVTYTYDAAGRLKTRSYPTTALNETFTYDSTASGNYGVGRLTRMQDAAGASNYVYDAHGRLIQETRTIGTYAHTVVYDYDGAGRLYAMHYPSGRTIRYGYDALGRRNYVDLLRTSSSSAEAIVAGVSYLPFGSIQTIYNQNDLRWSTTWDQNYRMTALTLTPNTGSGSTLIDRSFRYYDGLNLQEINNGNIDPAQTQGFDYDDASRMQSANGPYGGRYWTYDKVGNRLSEFKQVGSTSSSLNYVYYADSNRLQGMEQGGQIPRAFAHDAAGNIVTDTRSGTAYAYTISNAGRISQVSVGGTVKANYTYDGRNRLSIRQTLNSTPSGTQHLIHDAWDHVIVETNGAGQAVREYVWLGDNPVAVLDGSSTPSNPTLLWVHTDHIGRPELMTDATKAVKWKAVYEPFGTVSTITGAAALQMRFPGQWFQLEAGLAYNWNRHYDSTTGRYTQADPLGLSQGPQALALSTNLPSDTSPGISLAAIGNSIGLATIVNRRIAQIGLQTSLYYLMSSQQSNFWLESYLDFAVGAGPEGRGQRVRRDGKSLYAYVKQSPIMSSDPKGLQAFSGDQSALLDLAKMCKCVGATGEEANILLMWSREYGIRCSAGVESHDSGAWARPHINIKNLHIPIK